MPRLLNNGNAGAFAEVDLSAGNYFIARIEAL